MKFRFLHIAILTSVLLWAATSCIWEKGTDVYEDDVVVVSLPVENPSSESYSMDTKATDAAVNDGARKQGNTTENLIFSEIIRIVENNSRK